MEKVWKVKKLAEKNSGFSWLDFQLKKCPVNPKMFSGDTTTLNWKSDSIESVVVHIMFKLEHTTQTIEILSVAKTVSETIVKTRAHNSDNRNIVSV